MKTTTAKPTKKPVCHCSECHLPFKSPEAALLHKLNCDAVAAYKRVDLLLDRVAGIDDIARQEVFSKSAEGMVAENVWLCVTQVACEFPYFFVHLPVWIYGYLKRCLEEHPKPSKTKLRLVDAAIRRAQAEARKAEVPA